jgi:uncharacterized membrane protein HdeD (DUF308 family)
MSTWTLRLFIGVFLLLLGIAGISPNIGESIYSLSNSNYTLELIFGIVEVICGLVIFMGLFIRTQNKTVYNASVIVLIFWIARIILTKVIWSSVPSPDSPVFFKWSMILVTELIIASSIWLLAKSYRAIKNI